MKSRRLNAGSHSFSSFLRLRRPRCRRPTKAPVGSRTGRAAALGTVNCGARMSHPVSCQDGVSRRRGCRPTRREAPAPKTASGQWHSRHKNAPPIKTCGAPCRSNFLAVTGLLGAHPRWWGARRERPSTHTRGGKPKQQAFPPYNSLPKRPSSYKNAPPIKTCGAPSRTRQPVIYRQAIYHGRRGMTAFCRTGFVVNPSRSHRGCALPITISALLSGKMLAERQNLFVHSGVSFELARPMFMDNQDGRPSFWLRLRCAMSLRGNS
jgi:hypothetical protein